MNKLTFFSCTFCIVFTLINPLAFGAQLQIPENDDELLAFFAKELSSETQDTTKRRYRESRHISSDGFSKTELVYKGEIKLNDDDTRIESMSPNAYLKFTKKSFGNKRSVSIEADRKGNLTYEYYVGNKETPFEDGGAEWLETVLPDIIRITGMGAESRVKRIYEKSGTVGVLSEIRQIESSSVKGIYYDVLLNIPNLPSKDVTEISLLIGSDISSSSERGRLYRKYSSLFLKDDKTAQAFFTGISKISSSSEKGSILRKVLSTQKLSGSMLADLLASASRISSSSELGSVLSHVNRNFLNDDETIEAYFRTLNGISSSSEKGRVLRGLLKEENLKPESQIMLMRAVRGISSSSEQGSVLRSVSSQLPSKNDDVLDAYFDAVNGISSSSEKGSVLRTLIKEQPSDNRLMTYVASSTQRISSSTEQGSVLRALLSNNPPATDLPEAFFNVVHRISSSTEQGSVLRTTIKSKELTESDMKQIMTSVRYISSSTEQGATLRALAKIMPDSDELRATYRDAARNISSNTEYRSVMDALSY